MQFVKSWRALVTEPPFLSEVHLTERHSFCSCRLACIKNAEQVALEAGNSPQMIFQHYRQLVTQVVNQPGNQVEEILWTKRESARTVRRSERTVQIWMKEGRMPFIRIGPRDVLFKRAVLRMHFAPGR
jgi:hypothetical protein